MDPQLLSLKCFLSYEAEGQKDHQQQYEVVRAMIIIVRVVMPIITYAIILTS